MVCDKCTHAGTLSAAGVCAGEPLAPHTVLIFAWQKRQKSAAYLGWLVHTLRSAAFSFAAVRLSAASTAF